MAEAFICDAVRTPFGSLPATKGVALAIERV